MSCSSEYNLYEKRVLCSCNGLLQVEFKKLPEVSWSLFRSRPFRLWRYRELIPLPQEAKIVSLGEGGTPLIKAVNSMEYTGVKEVYVKFDGANPTGSFKDRGMTVAISVAKYLGAKIVACASTGNTSASMTAYASRAGIKPLIVLPKKSVAKGKLAQAILHGAEIVFVKGGFDEALKVIIEASKKMLVYPLNSINPWRIEGQKTVAYEIIDEIGVPDWIILPVGNAGNISAVWKGLVELKRAGLIDKLPRLAGVQASGAAPIVKTFKTGSSEPVFIDNPETIASAIRIGKPVNWMRALKAVKESNGVVIDVSDEEILEAQRILARREGLGVEPASAAAFAGLVKLRREKIIDKDEKVVVIATGHALKDPDAAVLHDTIAYEAESIEEALAMIRRISINNYRR
ncbi:threonine synthase [Desulfurococcaceae archaeon MEX13E-LK6-19]|nr:threonine synthase [Desulfurococcaceae archaeon MEX13E-LK6-19]